jgi:sulfite reductase (NADPH) flavoprotein alpha-component
LNWVKGGIDYLAGEAPAKKAGTEARTANAAGKSGPGKTPAYDILPADQLTRVWQGFTGTVPAYRMVSLRLPEKAGQPVQLSYLEPDAPHDRARSQMRIDPATGAVSGVQRYRDKAPGGRLLSAFYPLHMGTYFGLPGRIVMTLSALGLPLFGITGWMMYLGRRRKKRAVGRSRQSLPATCIR